MRAIFSPCGKYRYRLERRIADVGRIACMIMVNPSTADGETDDQTIRKLIGFGERNGIGRWIVGNKFAFVATDIKQLPKARDPIGPNNDAHLKVMLAECDIAVVGWGQLSKLPDALRSRWRDIVRMADAEGKELHCIGVNADGHPKHPQMTGYDVPLVPWTVPWFAGRGRA